MFDYFFTAGPLKNDVVSPEYELDNAQNRF